MKFSEINLIGFVQFFLKIKELFEDSKFTVTYSGYSNRSVSYSGGQSITRLPECTVYHTEERFNFCSITFEDPSFFAEDFDSLVKIVETNNNLVRMGFSCRLIPGTFGVNVPLEYFDDSNFIITLKLLLDNTYKDSGEEKDKEVFFNSFTSYFLKKVLESGITNYVPFSEFEEEILKIKKFFVRS